MVNHFAPMILLVVTTSSLHVSRRAALALLPASAATAAVASTSGFTSPAPLRTAAVAPSARVEFYSGLLAGAVQKTAKELVLHPLDTAKARLQVSRRRVAFAELIKAPYAGLAPALIAGAPAASAFFAIKDATKRSVADLGLGRTEKTLLAVACANIGYWGVKNPSEVLKVRRQAGVVGADTLGAARELWATEGLGGFYQSAVPNYLYSTPVDAAKFLLYEGLKSEILTGRGDGGTLTSVEAAVGGAIAASTAQALCTPLDVARVRIMTADDERRGLGIAETVLAIADEEGVGALYSGVVPKVARAVASGAIQFSTYEATKAWSIAFLTRTLPGSFSASTAS